jgi:uncharacterized protein (DUF305 family)
MTSRPAFAAGAAALPAAALAQHRHREPQHRPGADLVDFAAGMHRAMRTMAEAMHAAPTSGDADRDFLAMMIPHHQGAVEMARLVLVHGRDPLVRKLAEEIIAGQQAEIRSMEARLRVLQGGAPADADGFPALSGTRGR